MKYLSEYRNPALVEKLLKEIFAVTTKPWTLMEICGGQTHSLIKNGIPDLLPKYINLVHGPGCPVCVTNMSIIDEAVYLSKLPDVIFCSYGDMLRVPGSKESLLEAKASGADIRILYSPLEAVQLAKENPDKQVVFFAV
jgi:hydrogenase expression/formation protein HypD